MKKTSANNIVIMKKSKTIEDKKAKSKDKKHFRNADNKKSIICLGLKKQYCEDD